jgi:hypothetical protein
VLVVEVRSRLEHDEELAAIGAGATVGHRQHTTPAVQQPAAGVGRVWGEGGAGRQAGQTVRVYR